ncbi:hypothetical protein TWF281_005900 [Arthrobotrys megalospora]
MGGSKDKTPTRPKSVESPYRPRVKRAMIWHPDHCTRSFIVTDFYGDLNALIVQHGEVVKCCGQFWKANRRYGQDESEPHAIYKRYKSSTVHDADVAKVARPLDRCQCTPATVAKTTATVPPSTAAKITTTVPPSTAKNSVTYAPSPTIRHFPISSSTVPREQPPYPRRAPQPPAPPPSSYRDPGIPGRLPLERATGRVSEGFGSAVDKLRKGKEREDISSPGVSSSGFWGCVGEEGVCGGKLQEDRGGRDCQHTFYCIHCGGQNSVWSDKKGKGN